MSTPTFYSKYTGQITYQREVLGELKDGSGTSISDHGIRVALLIERIFGTACPETEAMVLAALHHDVLEDTSVTSEELMRVTPEEVVKLVEELTVTFEDRSVVEAVQPLYHVSPEAIIIKAADITDNVEKSRFYLSANAPGFYTSFFLPLLDEYERLIKFREVEVLERFPKAIKVLERMRRSIKDLREEVDLFCSIGLAL